MHSSFWFDYKLTNFVFKDFNIASVGGLLLLCCGFIAVAVLFEALKIVHVEAKMKSILLRAPINLSCVTDDVQLLPAEREGTKRKRLLWFLAELGLYVVQIMLGYLLMLAVMTYNGFITIAIALGATIGYYFFGHILMARQMKSARLTAPCHMCISGPTRDGSPVSTLIGNEEDEATGGCCSSRRDEDDEGFEDNEDTKVQVHQHEASASS